jgi:hypothetical protein
MGRIPPPGHTARVVGPDHDYQPGGCHPLAPTSAPYSGSLSLLERLCFTDHYDCATPGCFGPFTQPATMVDIDYPAQIPCSAGTCTFVSSFEATVLGSVPENKRSNIQVFRIRVNDPDGSLFAQHGLFVPDGSTASYPHL